SPRPLPSLAALVFRLSQIAEHELTERDRGEPGRLGAEDARPEAHEPSPSPLGHDNLLGREATLGTDHEQDARRRPRRLSGDGERLPAPLPEYPRGVVPRDLAQYLHEGLRRRDHRRNDSTGLLHGFARDPLPASVADHSPGGRTGHDTRGLH